MFSFKKLSSKSAVGTLFGGTVGSFASYLYFSEKLSMQRQDHENAMLTLQKDHAAELIKANNQIKREMNETIITLKHKNAKLSEETKMQAAKLDIFSKARSEQLADIAIYANNVDQYNISTENFAGYRTIVRTIEEKVFGPRVIGKYANAYGLKPVKGFILYGPPGTGKTTLIRHLSASIPGSVVRVVNGPELKSKYVGETEAMLRKIFSRSDLYRDQLLIILIDEIDSMFPARVGNDESGQARSDNSATSQLLTLIDGVNQSQNILIVGTTNLPASLDPALLRSGRLGLQIEMSLPSAEDRYSIFKLKLSTIAKNGLLHKDVDLNHYAAITANFSGADIEAVVQTAANQAAMLNLARNPNGSLRLHDWITTTSDLAIVTKEHMDNAYKTIRNQQHTDTPRVFSRHG